jgi:Leucine-rich repeat (LRR) protein
LLREPAKGRIDFPHRTFQEYLAACAAGYYDDAGNLAKRSMNDQWHETIVLAAGTPVGGSAFGNRLIEELLRRGTTLKQDRARNLSLALALACLETGMQIRPDLQKRVLEQLSRLVPPRSEVTARHLAVAADALLPHLRYENVKRHGWRAVALSAYAIARVGTHRAIQTLLDPNGYASDTRQSVVREICNCPSLNPLKLPYICQRLRDSTQDIDWQLARTLRNVEDLSPLANDGLIQCLPLTGCKRIDSFKPISTLIGLKYLWLSGTNLTDEGLIYLKALGVLEQLYLMGTQVTNEGIIHLQNLNSLKVLFLGGTQITDAGLAHLKNLTSLRTLSLEGTRVTDEGLAYLQDLRSLTWLSLAGTQLTDAGLAFLQNITSLESLSLEGTQITDAGLIYLQNLKSLNALSLNGTGVTDVGLGNLQNLTSLKSLLLYATRITDGGLAHLHKLQSLVVLSLNNTRVTDAGLVHLKDLTSLQEVSFMGTQISREGMHRLLQTNMRLRRWRISEYSGGSSGV